MTLNVSFTLPTTSGGGTAPLANPLANVALSLSADAGNTFAPLATVNAPGTTYTGPAPAPGAYTLKAVVVDTAGNQSSAATVNFTVAAPTAANPDPVTNLTVTLTSP